MTEQEKFIFKTLQWFMALGVTVMLFLQGYMITFIFDTYSWKSQHEMKHNINDAYYLRRIYIDSTNCNMFRSEIVNIKKHINILEIQNPKLEAILKREEEVNTNIENLE